MRLFHLVWFSIPATILIICVGVAAYNWSAIRQDYLLWDSSSAKNPSYLYWPTAQAQKVLEPARLDLRMIADGSPVDPDTLSLHLDVLISTINIIIRPSELNDRFRQLPGFLQADKSAVRTINRRLQWVHDIVEYPG